MNYVLIILIASTNYAVTTQSFNSKQSCEQALNWLKHQVQFGLTGTCIENKSDLSGELITIDCSDPKHCREIKDNPTRF